MSIPHIEDINSAVDSINPPPHDKRRRRIDGHLLGIGDTVYIISLKYNGTILDFRGKRILVIPHDYGYPDLFPRLILSLAEASTAISACALTIWVIITLTRLFCKTARILLPTADIDDLYLPLIGMDTAKQLQIFYDKHTAAAIRKVISAQSFPLPDWKASSKTTQP